MQLLHHHQMDARRKRGTFLGFWNISHNLGGEAQQVWRCSAQITCSMVMSSHVYFPVDYRADCWFYRSALRSDSPESYGLGKAEELFGEETVKRIKRQNLPI